jgi:hypothetical protein
VLADRLAAGESAARLRSYLKKPAIETWEYVNRLTHAKDAVRMDAEVGLKAVEQLLGTFTPRGTGSKCTGDCGSYQVVTGACRHRGRPSKSSTVAATETPSPRFGRSAQPSPPAAATRPIRHPRSRKLTGGS